MTRPTWNIAGLGLGLITAHNSTEVMTRVTPQAEGLMVLLSLRAQGASDQEQAMAFLSPEEAIELATSLLLAARASTQNGKVL